MTLSSRFNPVAVVLALALGGMTQAAPRRAVLASGDCKDAALSSQTKALHDTLSARAGEDVLTPADFAERLFPPPSGSLADIQRQFEAARGQFYEARHTRAVQSLGEVLEQVVRLPVGETRWKLFVDTWLLQGMTLRALGRMKESDEAFLNVLRLDAQYQLDPDYYTPSTRQAFDKLRRELARARKVRLSVKSSAPSSEVFLDGRSVGQTPLVLEVPPGTYSLTLKKGDAVSFPRQLSVQGEETPVHVDLAYEGAVSATPFPCLATPEEGGEQGLSYAVRLGGTLGVEEVIVVRLEGASSGPKWLAATVLNVEGGQKLREGGFKTRGLDAPAESLSALVDFITTGKEQPSVVVAQPHLQPPWVTPLPSAVSATRPEPSGPSATRVASYVTLGVGVAALAAAGGVRLSAEQEWAELQRGHLNENGRVEADDATGRRLVGQLSRKGQVLTGLLIGSGAALATGAVLFLVSPSPRAPPAVSVDVTAGPDGAGASLSGTF
ncbi:PEGA domain-containing protein [Cystobacter fuscus]|uniref:PEGA domain-containing protein n=1 Tax=Cystobacter fuscus TaxID=43 RepID=UPI002B2C4668|nr:PEGA domain-containing protein [Cystobacter fuscus]